MKLVGKLYALQFATREGCHRLVEVQVAKSHLVQGKKFWQKWLVGKEFDGFFDAHSHHFGDVLALVAVR